MSLRAFSTKLFKHGTSLLRAARKRDLNTSTITEKIKTVQSTLIIPHQLNTNIQRSSPKHLVLRNVGAQIGLHARRILIDNVLNRVTNSLAGDLRKRAARRILYGDSGPFFAFVGVSLASGTGILTKEEELEGICWEIRESISKVKWNYHDIDIENIQSEQKSISLKDLSIGKALAKGSNAVVYAAKLKDDQKYETTENKNEISKYPFALKMMFNYDIQSNAMAILKAMYRETVPARMISNEFVEANWQMELMNSKRYLPPHPNIVAIFSVFTDFIPNLDGAIDLYPAALPRRIYEDGEGRNMSLFLLAKRYDMTLEKFLQSEEISMRTRVLLFTQLLEGVAHLAAHKIAHRDLKSDNILIDTSDDAIPSLVISDFGCCLADKNKGLHISYTSDEIDKGGNTALMAPEIYTQVPGTFSVLNYSKSDLWTAGTIAYEIFGMNNPFYKGSDGKKLYNYNYTEKELPDLPNEVPDVFKFLIKNILSRNPNKRLDPDVAANVCQLYLWAPSNWLRPGKIASSTEILQWLLSLTTKILCKGRLQSQTEFLSPVKNDEFKSGRRTYPEYLLISSFLCRASIFEIRNALSWIQNNIFDQ